MISYFIIEKGGKSTTYKNLVVDGGKSTLLSLLRTPSNGQRIQYIKVGSSSTPTVNSQTDLLSEISIAEISKSVQDNSSVVFEAFFNYNEGNGNINEVGVFTADGTMFARSKVDTEEKASTETMMVKYVISLEDLNV